MSIQASGFVSDIKAATQEAAQATKLTSDLLGQFLSAQNEMSVHAKRNHAVTLSGIIITAALSLSSVCVSVYGLNSTPKQNPANAAYQKEMREMTQEQVEAVRDQTQALNRLDRELADAETYQRRAAVEHARTIKQLALADHADTSNWKPALTRTANP